MVKFLTLAPFAMVIFSVLLPVRSKVLTSPLPFRVIAPPLFASNVLMVEPFARLMFCLFVPLLPVCSVVTVVLVPLPMLMSPEAFWLTVTLVIVPSPSMLIAPVPVFISLMVIFLPTDMLSAPLSPAIYLIV